MGDPQPRIVCFSCSFSWGYLADTAQLAEQLPDWTVVPCCGRIEPQQILTAFTQGAAGVLVAGCASGECHFQDGNLQLRKRVALLHQVLAAHGVNPERLVTHFDRDPEGTKLVALVATFRAALVTLTQNETNYGVGAGKDRP